MSEKIIGKIEKKPVRITLSTQVPNLLNEAIQKLREKKLIMLAGKRQDEYPFWMNAGRVVQIPTDFYITGILSQEEFLKFHHDALNELSSGQPVALKMPDDMPTVRTPEQAIKYLEGIMVEVEKQRDACDVFVPTNEMTKVQAQQMQFRKYLMTVGRSLQAPKDLWGVGLIDEVAFQSMYQRGMNTLGSRVVGVT